MKKFHTKNSKKSIFILAILKTIKKFYSRLEKKKTQFLKYRS